MKNVTRAFLLCALLLAESCITAPPGQTPQVFTVPGTATRVSYLLYLPAAYASAPARHWPLILFLHGYGERGTDLSLVKRWGPPAMLDRRTDFPFVVVSPQLAADGTRWPPAMLGALLDRVEQTVRIDTDRIYVTGLSWGGAGTWALAIAEPTRFAAIAPVAGFSDPGQAARISRVPAWVFHGARDTIVPPSASQDMVDALKAAGGEVRFTLIPDSGHDIWKRVYDDPALYDWFLSHRRGE